MEFPAVAIEVELPNYLLNVKLDGFCIDGYEIFSVTVRYEAKGRCAKSF